MIIAPRPDIYQYPGKKDKIRYIGPEWIEDLSRQLSGIDLKDQKSLILDISQIDFVTLFEWMGVIAFFETLQYSGNRLGEILIDAVGEKILRIVPPSYYIRNKKGELIPFTQEEIDHSERVYKILGFIESVGGLSVMRHPYANIGYRWMQRESASLKAFYSAREDDPIRPTVLFPVRRIETKDNCREFAMDWKIGSWRAAMADRFLKAPVFHSEEFWRVICYELAANVWEHAGITGFLSARVVEPFDPNNQQFLHRWRLTYEQITDEEQKEWMKKGLLEIIVSDCGYGLTKTLENAYYKSQELNESSIIDARDILCFAFDELGTSKKRDDSWLTARHALSRILRIVGKYGGSIRLRSGGYEVIYRGKGTNSFKRLRKHSGIEPTDSNKTPFYLPGTQLQVVLPLYPPINTSRIMTRRSVLQSHLPSSYQTQSEHAIGHLVPLLEELKQPNVWVGEEEAKLFRRACEKLCRRLLIRPRDEAIVLDFSGLEWTSEQFETLLHLLQNVLHHRPALLIELDPHLALQVIRQEEVMASTQVSPVFSDRSPGVTGQSVSEIGIQYFLETYRGVHAILLGLDRDGKKFIFGLPKRSYEQALLELIYEQQSVAGICASHGIEGVDQDQFRAVLNGPNPAFFIDKDGNWHS